LTAGIGGKPTQVAARRG